MLNRFIKTLLKRPFTFAELRTQVDEYIANPPVPNDFRQELAKLKSKKGVSFLDYWRRNLEEGLTDISLASTWHAQRAILLKKLLGESTWQAAYTVSTECKRVQSWRQFLDPAFEEAVIAEDQLPFLLFQRFVQALLSSVVLEIVGERCYAVNRTKILELRLYREMDVEIKRLVASLNETANSGNDSEALILARFQERFDSIYRELTDELNVVEEQIVNGSVDVAAVGKSRDKIKVQKEELARLLTQSKLDAEDSDNWLRKYLPTDVGNSQEAGN